MTTKTLTELLEAAFRAGIEAEPNFHTGVREQAANYGEQAAGNLERLGYKLLPPEPGPPTPCDHCGKLHDPAEHSGALQ